MEEIRILTPFIKLDQLVKFAGLSETGAKAKILIDLGEFNVNGECCTKRGKKIKPGDVIEFKNKKYKVIYDEEAAAAVEAEKAAQNPEE
ncbi:MAG: RNA-binding S4 domain-containing protein [Oscillospiraceae bacterium]|nr:RNA-binding S4 domain-containing protein [Oscillospiraceae bacterium]